MMVTDDIDATEQGINPVKVDPSQSKQRKRVERHSKVDQQSLAAAQNAIFQYLLSIVKIWPSENVLDEFKHLFIRYGDSRKSLDSPIGSDLLAVMQQLLAANQEKEFKNTLKRSCYILINNWDINRSHDSIKDLIQLFSDSSIRRPSKQPLINRLRRWLQNFVTSADFRELTLFAARYDDFEKLHWSQRYTSYLLVSQYVNLTNSVEQREAAQAMSQKLRKRFKTDLALYTAISESTVLDRESDRIKDPTVLGDDSLQLIKRILMCYGPFSYENLASIFCKQTLGLGYEKFKDCLKTYLLRSLPDETLSPTIERYIDEKLSTIYTSYSDKSVNEALLLRTCNRMIECLTTEDHENPSDTFLWLVAQGSPLTTVLILLKLLLICRNTRTHLEARIADLIRHYESYPEEECRGVIDFFEIFNITMTVYGEDIRYSLVSIDGSGSSASTSLEAYRIFSQVKSPQPDNLDDNSDRGPADALIDHFINDFIEHESTLPPGSDS